ncbi:hypothetical protein V3595_06205 [Bacillus sp. CFBP9009]
MSMRTISTNIILKIKSSAKATQYGKDVDAKKLREDTMANYDRKWTTKD